MSDGQANDSYLGIPYRSKEIVDENDSRRRRDRMECTYGLACRNLRRSRVGLKQG
jgi:hypothetical protein